jgi:hypothetical protein
MRWRLRAGRGLGDDGNAGMDAKLSETWEAAAAAVGRMLDLPAGKEALLASSGLSQEGVADLRVPAGVTRRAARRRRRRLALRLASGAVALAAGAVALVAVTVPGAGHDGSRRSAVDTAYLVKRVDSALSAAGPGEIAQMTLTTGSGAAPDGTTAPISSEEWSNGDQWRSVTNSPAGGLLYDEGSSTSSVYTVVNYQTRVWAQQSSLGRPASMAPGARGCGPVVAALPLLFAYGLPRTASEASSLPSAVAGDLRAAVSCGTLAEAGQQRVDGIQAIELTSSPDSPIAETIWVGPATYLPVRVVVRPAPGQPGPSQTAEITWLPPTAPNLADLTVPIPAGFRHVSLAQAVTPIMQPAANGNGAAVPATTGP